MPIHALEALRKDCDVSTANTQPPAEKTGLGPVVSNRRARFTDDPTWIVDICVLVIVGVLVAELLL